MKTEVCPVCKKVGSGSLGGKCPKCGVSVIVTNMPFGEYLKLTDEKEKAWVDTVLSQHHFASTVDRDEQNSSMANVCPQCGLVEFGVQGVVCSRCGTTMILTDTAYSQYQGFDADQAKTWKKYILDEYQKEGGVVDFDNINKPMICPRCGKMIDNPHDRFCYFCGENLLGEESRPGNKPIDKECGDRLTTCPDCCNKVSMTAKVCPHCGREMKGKPTQPYHAPSKVNDACKVAAIIIVLVGLFGGLFIGYVTEWIAFWGVAVGSILLALLFWSIGEIIQLLQILIEQNKYK